MNEMNFDWDDLRLFLSVARNRGLAGAAVETGKSPPTLGRRMLALEKALGAELFHRLPRGYELTEEGREFLAKAADLGSRVEQLQNMRRDRPLVKISAGTWMTRELCARSAEILGNENDITLRFVSDDHVLEIAHREVVVGIRNRRPMEIGLACRKVGRVRFAGYAVNKEVCRWVRVTGDTPSAIWVRENTEPSDIVEVTHPINALDLAMSGAFRAVLPTFVGDTRRQLTQVTPPIDALEHDQWLVTHNEDRFIPEVRRTIDRIHGVLTKLHR